MKLDTERQVSHCITYMWNLKKRGTSELIYKTESQTQKTNIFTRGGGVGIKWVIRMDIFTLFFLL